MQTESKGFIITTLILFLFNFITLGNHFIVSELPQEPIHYKIFSDYKEISIKGAYPIESRTHAQNVIEVEIGNIPLRKQVWNSCGSTSLAMMMDWLDKPYRTQEFYDECTNRKPNGVLYIWELKKCADIQGVRTRKDLNYKTERLKTGDIVLYHFMGYSNSTDMHYSVVDSITPTTIRLANPHGKYNEYTIKEFKSKYVKEALVLQDGNKNKY